MEQRK